MGRPKISVANDVVGGLQIALREARRRNTDYQEYAIRALAKVVARWAVPQASNSEQNYGTNLFEAVMDVSSTAIDNLVKPEDEDAMDVDVNAGDAARQAQRYVDQRCITHPSCRGLLAALAVARLANCHDNVQQKAGSRGLNGPASPA